MTLFNPIKVSQKWTLWEQNQKCNYNFNFNLAKWLFVIIFRQMRFNYHSNDMILFTIPTGFIS